ncbi:MAG: DUF2752 domain-containing protein [Phycisphaerales bacterium]|nr:MAG: DUF2752 domain-containing protein [Phycisphaerales bacterium]
MTPRRAEAAHRVLAALVAAGCLAVLGVAAFLSPAAEGVGTHTQLGLPTCGWIARHGRPCPTCGMTTSFTHAAGADLFRAVVVQPAGALLALTTAAVFWGTLYVAATGSTLARALGKAVGLKVLWIALGIGAAAWAYKLLTTPVVY